MLIPRTAACVQASLGFVLAFYYSEMKIFKNLLNENFSFNKIFRILCFFQFLSPSMNID